LSDVAEVEELGLFEAFEMALCLVEWPDRLGAETPVNALTLAFSMGAGEGDRNLAISARNGRWDWVMPIIVGLGGQADG